MCEMLMIYSRACEGKHYHFTDPGVYSKNRLFRCLSSSKFKKRICLTNTGRFTNPDSQKELFLSSLVCLPFVPESPIQYDDVVAVPRPAAPRAAASSAVQPCPHPEIVAIVLQEHKRMGGQGGQIQVSQWQLTPSGILRFRVNGSKFCEQAGRHHRNNNVQWNVNLSNETYHQTCFDPDCKGTGTVRSYLNDTENQYQQDEGPVGAAAHQQQNEQQVRRVVGWRYSQEPSTL